MAGPERPKNGAWSAARGGLLGKGKDRLLGKGNSPFPRTVGSEGELQAPPMGSGANPQRSGDLEHFTGLQSRSWCGLKFISVKFSWGYEPYKSKQPICFGYPDPLTPIGSAPVIESSFLISRFNVVALIISLIAERSGDDPISSLIASSGFLVHVGHSDALVNAWPSNRQIQTTEVKTLSFRQLNTEESAGSSSVDIFTSYQRWAIHAVDHYRLIQLT